MLRLIDTSCFVVLVPWTTWSSEMPQSQKPRNLILCHLTLPLMWHHPHIVIRRRRNTKRKLPSLCDNAGSQAHSACTSPVQTQHPSSSQLFLSYRSPISPPRTLPPFRKHKSKERKKAISSACSCTLGLQFMRQLRQTKPRCRARELSGGGMCGSGEFFRRSKN